MGRIDMLIVMTVVWLAKPDFPEAILVRYIWYTLLCSTCSPRNTRSRWHQRKAIMVTRQQERFGLVVIALVLSYLELFSTSKMQLQAPQNFTEELSETGSVLPLNEDAGIHAGAHKGVCGSLLGYLARNTDTGHIYTASSVWNDHAQAILNATLRPEEAPNKMQRYTQWIQNLFHIMSTDRLRKALHSFPQTAQLQSILNILESKIKNPDTAPPLRIGVLGGSVTSGHGCTINPLGLKQVGFRKHVFECAWPIRLEKLVNDLVGLELVQVVNAAWAATTSDVASVVVDYNLWPKSLQPQGPDIIISAFSANDPLANPYTAGIDKMQNLAQSVEQAQDCETGLPLLVQFEEFVGGPESVDKWLLYHNDMVRLAEWNQYAAVSYADAVRDYVYADWQNNVVKAAWKMDPKWGAQGNIHPGMGVHIMSTWVLAYSMLQIGLETCSTATQQKPFSDRVTPEFSPPELFDGPRPPLTTEQLTTIKTGELWKESAAAREGECLDRQVRKGQEQCSFMWFANRLSDFKSVASIQEKMETVLTYNDGWKAGGPAFASKHGWLAEQPNATFTMVMPNVTSDVLSISILSLKSYSEDWVGSRLEIRVFSEDAAPVSTFHIDGYHDDTKTSVILPHALVLEEPQVIKKGRPLRLEFELVGGKSFKISGMAICSRKI